MDFKLVSKNNMGIVITLILVILLSQSRWFDFLTGTALGRTFILVQIILISYRNKFLGLLAVLFIIIAFNQYNMNVVQSYNYYEGFDVSGNININAKEKVEQKMSAVNNAAQTANTPSNSGTSTPSSENFKGREGFCMPDRELNILRGKQSNTIPVLNNTREQDDDISPTDKSVFSSSYALF